MIQINVQAEDVEAFKWAAGINQPDRYKDDLKRLKRLEDRKKGIIHMGEL